MRYARQPQATTCGPVAILNAIKWAGGRATLRRDYARLIKNCLCNYGRVGTHTIDFNKCLRKESRRLFKVKTVPSPKLRDIENHLCEKNKALILQYGFRSAANELQSHLALFLAVSKSGKTFVSVNLLAGQTVSCISRVELINYLKIGRRNKEWLLPRAWFLTKHNS